MDRFVDEVSFRNGCANGGFASIKICVRFLNRSTFGGSSSLTYVVDEITDVICGSPQDHTLIPISNR